MPPWSVLGLSLRADGRGGLDADTVACMVRRTRVLIALGVVLMAGGGVVALQPRALGWAAYTPLSTAPFTSSTALVVLDAVGIAAVAVFTLGVAVLAGSVGYRLGTRGATSSSGN